MPSRQSGHDRDRILSIIMYSLGVTVGAEESGQACGPGRQRCMSDEGDGMQSRSEAPKRPVNLFAAIRCAVTSNEGQP